MIPSIVLAIVQGLVAVAPAIPGLLAAITGKPTDDAAREHILETVEKKLRVVDVDGILDRRLAEIRAGHPVEPQPAHELAALRQFAHDAVTGGPLELARLREHLGGSNILPKSVEDRIVAQASSAASPSIGAAVLEHVDSAHVVFPTSKTCGHCGGPLTTTPHPTVGGTPSVGCEKCGWSAAVGAAPAITFTPGKSTS